jgi:uncharacterized protein YaiE (UPF0345 family)
MSAAYIELPTETDRPPVGHEEAYERRRYDDEKFQLKSGVAQYIAERESEVAAAEAEATAALGAERVAHAHTKQLLHDRLINGALEAALKAGGAKPSTRAGAIALLRAQWQFSVSDDETVAAISGDADIDLTQAIEHWLAGDAGEAFSNRRPSTTATALARIQQITR